MGGSYDSSGKWTPSATPGSMTYGFPNYTGDVEAIFRETFIRAMEVSLGLHHKEKLEQQSPDRARFWPLEFIWKCPVAWVEGWVTWQRAPDGSGHVTVHMLTPSHNHFVLTSPGDGRAAVLNPDDSECANGMWVVTHQKNKMQMKYHIDYSEFGNWHTPTYGPTYEGVGPIVVVSPSEQDGGVSCWGRPSPPRRARRAPSLRRRRKQQRRRPWRRSRPNEYGSTRERAHGEQRQQGGRAAGPSRHPARPRGPQRRPGRQAVP